MHASYWRTEAGSGTRRLREHEPKTSPRCRSAPRWLAHRSESENQRALCALPAAAEPRQCLQAALRRGPAHVLKNTFLAGRGPRCRRSFTDIALTFSVTMLNAVVDLISFSGILYSIYPPLFVAIVVYAGASR